jgi:DHA2 family multidrug resistance protein-like MFS transporter
MVAIAFSSSQTYGALLGVGVGVSCALVAVAINIARHLDPTPDQDPS